jgi:hypothetical protein
MRIINGVAVIRDKWGMEEDCIGSQGMQQNFVFEKKQQKKKKKNRNLFPKIYTYFRIHYIKLKKSYFVPGSNSIHSFTLYIQNFHSQNSMWQSVIITKLNPSIFNTHLSERMHLNVTAVSLLQWASTETLTKP